METLATNAKWLLKRDEHKQMGLHVGMLVTEVAEVVLKHARPRRTRWLQRERPIRSCLCVYGERWIVETILL